MKEAEDYPFCLDCWKRREPDTEYNTPANKVGSESRAELEAQADKLWSARKLNGYRCLILYHDAGDDWEEVRRWD